MNMSGLNSMGLRPPTLANDSTARLVLVSGLAAVAG